MRLLVVDDSARFRDAFARLLHYYLDIEAVAQAGSLAEAREKLSGVDVALLDLHLPDGEGIELIGELREVSPDVKVLAMSATVETNLEEQIRGAGVEGIVDKTAPPDQIAAQIRALRNG